MSREPNADLIASDDLGHGENYHHTRPFGMYLLALAGDVVGVVAWIFGALVAVAAICLIAWACGLETLA